MSESRLAALIPGARGAIGSVVAETLAERGMDLWLGARSVDPAMLDLAERLRAHGGRVTIVPLEATDPRGITSWVEGAHAGLGRVDILANCLGWHGETPFLPAFR